MLKMKPKKAYLKPIKIRAGQFSNERSVRFLCYDGTETSGFIDNKYIKNKQLEIKVIKEQ